MREPDELYAEREEARRRTADRERNVPFGVVRMWLTVGAVSMVIFFVLMRLIGVSR
jgi:hypothetical protein